VRREAANPDSRAHHDSCEITGTTNIAPDHSQRVPEGARPSVFSPRRRAAGSTHPDGRERLVMRASGRGMRLPDRHDQSSLEGLAGVIAGFAEACTHTMSLIASSVGWFAAPEFCLIFAPCGNDHPDGHAFAPCVYFRTHMSPAPLTSRRLRQFMGRSARRITTDQ